MTRVLSAICICLLCSLSVAQDLVITNARILDGTGTTIERGSVVVRGGQISSVTAGSTVAGVNEIDAQGMTVMPGFIDTHRHVIRSSSPLRSQQAMDRWLDEEAPVHMQDYLDAGFTTIMSAGDSSLAIVELRERLDSGKLTGPRLFVSGDRIRKPTPEQLASCEANEFCRTNNSLISNADEARAKVRELVAIGVDMVKIRLDRFNPTGIDKAILAAIADEAKLAGVPSIVHATSVQDMIDAVEAGTTRLVHTPHTGAVAGTKGPQMVVDAGIPMSSTLGVWVPLFGEENDLRWRNGAPFPPPGINRAGQGPINARLLWDAGVPIAYGTDTGFSAADSLAHELRPLQLLFSPQDIVAMLTRHAASFLDLNDEIGTLAVGKDADIVIVDGDPLADIDAVLNVALVIQRGEIVADHR